MRTLFRLIVVALLLVMPVAILADTYQLLAGNPKNGITEIGKVEVWDDGSVLYVKYVLDAPYWHLTSTHLAVGNSLSDIPQTKNDNPVPGQFPYYETMTDPDYYNEDEGRYEIPLSAVGGAVYPKYIAAHGVACYDLTSSSLPAEVTMQLSDPDPDPSIYNYIKVNITDPPGVLKGVHIGYCLDSGTIMDIPGTYTVSVSTNGLDEMNQVNYLLNKYDGLVDHSTMQAALWLLLPTQSVPGYYPLPPPDWDKAAEIAKDAQDNGGDFEPRCGDYIGIKLESKQRILIKIRMECDCDTAWAGLVNGEKYFYEFGGKNWALYVIYPKVNGAPPRMSLDSSVTTTWGSIKNR